MKKGDFKNLLARNRWLKWVPNALTICNSLCGFAAILYALTVYERGLAGQERDALKVFAVCAWIILFAMIFDALDGFAARILNAASMRGIQMDSLADMVTFGLAPAVVAAIMTHWLREPTFWLNTSTYLLCAVYVGCAALRLATYNVQAMQEKKSSNVFSGLPSPGAAAGICSVVIVWDSLDGATLQPLANWLPVYAAVLGLLMVSTIPYVHVGKWLVSVRRNPRRIAFLLVILAIVGVFRLPGLAALINIYILAGPVCRLVALIRRRTLRAEPAS